jgi:hypothetical protein
MVLIIFLACDCVNTGYNFPCFPRHLRSREQLKCANYVGTGVFKLNTQANYVSAFKTELRISKILVRELKD